LKTGRSIIVRINDRGPFIRGRIIDLAYGAARAVGLQGVGKVEVTVVK
jgi:rare lipoprotein A